MRSLFRTMAVAAVAAATLFALPALAQAGRDPVIEAARGAGQVGEQADGYLGFVQGQAPNADLKARVDQTNIKRRAIYTDAVAGEPGKTVADMAAATACELFGNRVDVGHFYRGADGVWRQRKAGEAMALPPYCAQ
jgi:hypothetical protein